MIAHGKRFALGLIDEAVKLFVVPQANIGLQTCRPAVVGRYFVSWLIEEFLATIKLLTVLVNSRSSLFSPPSGRFLW